MGNNFLDVERRHSRSSSRRQFLRTVATTGMGTGILSQSATVLATDNGAGVSDPDNPWEPDPPGGGGGSGDISNIWKLSDSVTDEYAGSAEGHATLAVAELHAESKGNHSWDEIPIQLSGNAITQTDSDDFLSNVTHSASGVTWDDDAADGAAGPLIFAEENTDYIGGYYDGYDGGENDDALYDLLSIAIGFLPINSLVFEAGMAIADLLLMADVSEMGPDSHHREWNWGQKIQTTWWTKYEIRLDPGETLAFNVGDVVSLYGKSNALTPGGTFEVMMPWTVDSLQEQIEARVSIEQLRRAGPKGIALPDIYDGLVAYAGSVVKKYPSLSSKDSTTIAQFDDDRIHYRYPVDMSYKGPLPDDFDERLIG